MSVKSTFRNGSAFPLALLFMLAAVLACSSGSAKKCTATLTLGGLTFVGEEWTRGNYPRSFNFDPTGEFLYCCNQRADNVTVLRVDRKTGRLVFTGHYTPVGNPSSIVFLDLAKAG